MAEEYEAHKTAMAAKEAAETERKANAATISGSVATLMDDGGDDFVKKWSGPMILGALVPAIFAAFKEEVIKHNAA